MKKTLIFAVSMLISAAAFGQGSVVFGNSGTVVRAPIYDVEPGNPTLSKTGNTSAGIPMGAQTYGGPLLAGTGFTMQLWGNGSADGAAPLVLLNTTTFRTGTAAGFINNLTTTVPNAPL